MEQVILNIGLGVSKHFIQTTTEAQRIKEMEEVEDFFFKYGENIAFYKSKDDLYEVTYIIQLNREQYFNLEKNLLKISNYLEQDCISVCLSKEEKLGKFIGKYADKWQEETPWDIQYFKFD